MGQIDIHQLQVGRLSLLLPFIRSKFHFCEKFHEFVPALKGSRGIHEYVNMTVTYMHFICDLLEINPCMIHDIPKGQLRILRDLRKLVN